MRNMKLLILVCLLLYIPASWQCRQNPKMNGEFLERQKQRRQELTLWCHSNCVTEWSSWGPCDAQCGHGKGIRSRTLANLKFCNLLKDFNCLESLSQEADCNVGCPYGGIASDHRCSGCPSGRKGTCCEIEIKCPHLLNPTNGKIDGDWPARPETRVNFHCDTGFTLIGQSFATCFANNSWSNPAPMCQQIICYQPVQNPNVIILNAKQQGYAFGEQVGYDCEDGYTLVGVETRTCERGVTGTGVWTGYDAQCKPVKCPVPQIPQNGDILNMETQTFSFQYKEIVRFTCDEGYKLIGSDALLCLASGTWFGHQPKCEALSCDLPITSLHGLVRINKAGGRAIAFYECDEGYHLEPHIPYLICSNGNWSGTEPQCVVASCDDPGQPKHGIREGGVFTFGSNVTFHCERGYQMTEGTKTMKCQSNSKWSGSLPVCEACPVNYYMDDEICALCPANSSTATSASTSISQCLCDQDNGFVGPPGGPCEEVFCTYLTPPENGAVLECGNKVGDSCKLSCNDGFVVERGSTKRNCGNTGEWDGTEPFCLPCKLNTYRSDRTTCSPCPMHSHTEQTGQMLQGCLCDEGFKGPPGGPCVDIDECQLNNGKGVCSDECENTLGKFRCRCTVPGYKIDPRNELLCAAEHQCRNLTRDDAPENGALICHWFHEQNSQHCTSECNVGFELPNRVNDYETCGPSTGFIWSHQVRNATEHLDPCIPEFMPGFRLSGESIYFVAKCEELTKDQERVAKEVFANRLNDKGVCSRGKTQMCHIKDMAIICGRTTRRRKRRGVEILEQSLDFVYNVSAIKFEDKVSDCHAKICPLLRIPARFCNKLCKPTFKRYLRATVEYARMKLIEIHKDKSKLIDLTFNVDNLKFEPKEEGFKSSDVIQECPPGMMGIDGQCVPCLAGSYLDEENNVCVKCHKNHFQNEDLQTSCIPCQVYFGPGFYTNKNGSVTCQVCPAGSWGPDCINECDCVHGTCIPMTGDCICPSGWEGDHCERDVNSCLEGSCFPGVTCIDQPPPGIGFSCGPCPPGYHGDGITCTSLLAKHEKRHTHLATLEL